VARDRFGSRDATPRLLLAEQSQWKNAWISIELPIVMRSSFARETEPQVGRTKPIDKRWISIEMPLATRVSAAITPAAPRHPDGSAGNSERANWQNKANWKNEGISTEVPIAAAVAGRASWQNKAKKPNDINGRWFLNTAAMPYHL
jgi:hypothetical protein